MEKFGAETSKNGLENGKFEIDFEPFFDYAKIFFGSAGLPSYVDVWKYVHASEL